MIFCVRKNTPGIGSTGKFVCVVARKKRQLLRVGCSWKDCWHYCACVWECIQGGED